VGVYDFSMQVLNKTAVKYHSIIFLKLTFYGQCMIGSLTGAVAS